VPNLRTTRILLFCSVALVGGCKASPPGKWEAYVITHAKRSILVPNSHTGNPLAATPDNIAYQRWKKTPMANVVRDPREHPDAIIPDMSKPDPLVKFTKDDVALVYGSLWKQRYFTKAGDDYFPEGAQWDVTHRVWRPYFVAPGTDWWEPFYPADNMKRPTGPTCDGCHSVNYNVHDKTVTEWNVGCEPATGREANMWSITRTTF
jgi:hypothetical protein